VRQRRRQSAQIRRKSSRWDRQGSLAMFATILTAGQSPFGQQISPAQLFSVYSSPAPPIP
jgi:hypothetical protein